MAKIHIYKRSRISLYFFILLSLPMVLADPKVDLKFDSNISPKDQFNKYGEQEDPGIFRIFRIFNNIPNERNEKPVSSSEESETTTPKQPSSTSTIRPTTEHPFFRMTTEKVILMLIISFSIPVAFMGLLFWRLRKEKKYMNPRAGALVYSDTILVPNHTMSNSPNSISNNNAIAVNQMYSTLYYDTPPEYDAVVKSQTVLEKSEKPPMERHIIASTDAENIPPPAYSSVYM